MSAVDNAVKFAPLVAAGVVLFVVWKLVDKLSDNIGEGAADLYLWLRGQVGIAGKLVLPDHSLVSFNTVSTYWVGNQLRTKINGVEYQIHPHDERGNYPATRV